MKFQIGDHVKKVTGEYGFVGHVRAAFTTSSWAERYVVEHEDLHMLHIFNEGNLELIYRIDHV